MQVATILTKLAAEFAIVRVSAPTGAVAHVQIADDTLQAPGPGTLYLDVDAAQVTLLIYRDQVAVCVATLALKPGDKTTPLKLLAFCGECLAQPPVAAVASLAIAAITADFNQTLKSAAALLGNPLCLLSLDGQHILRYSAPVLAPERAIGRFLAARVPALDPHNFYHHLYLTNPDQSPVPLLLTPLAYHNNAMGHLAMAVTETPVNAQQLTVLPQLGQLISHAAVRTHAIAATVSARDRLVNLLLTAPMDATWAAQFRLQDAHLPEAMILIRCLPAADQSLTDLRERLKYLATPMFAQCLISLHHHQCLALVTVSLRTYHSALFHVKLEKLASLGRCRLIVSHWYTRPEDTAAAALVCARTAKLRSDAPVVYCEDAFFDLLLGQVDAGATILPFFINPALQVLAAHDRTYHSALVATLSAYLQATCNQAATAAALYIHPNTLRNRLHRITALTGLDLKDAQTCFKLAASLKVQDYLAANGL